MAKVKLGDFEVTLNGELPKVGSSLPNFLLADGDLNNVDLEQFKGKRLVLNIFPSMNTPVCSASVVQFNNLASDFDNTVVLCCLLYTSPSPRDRTRSRMPSSA